MLFKKFVSVLIAVAMVMSMSVFISVSATDLTSGNYHALAGGTKGNQNNSTWLRAHRGGGDTSRELARETVQSGKTVTGETNIINAYNFTSTTTSGAKFVHSTFKFNATNDFKLKIRIGTDNRQWMNFYVSGGVGYVNGNGGTAVNFDGRWNVSTVGNRINNTVHMIINAQTGTGYCFINNKLVAYTQNLQTDGSWAGYSIYSDGTWNEGDNFEWNYNEDYTVGYTWYEDTAEHTVAIEDVIAHHNVLGENADSHLNFSSNDAADFMHVHPTTTGSTFSYPSTGSVTITTDYYNADGNYTQAAGYWIPYEDRGYQLEQGNFGGDVLYMSYTQKINNASKIEMRINAGGTSYNSNRLSFLSSGGNIRVSSFNNKAKTLDKAWNTTNTIDVGIVIDRSGHKAYTFIDGEQLGDPFSFSGDFEYLRILLNGTSDNSVASVTLTNWMLKEYDSTKQRNELIAEIEGRPVYFKDSGNSFSSSGAITMDITAEKRFDKAASVVSGAQIYVAAYDSDGNLVNFAKRAYSDGTTLSGVTFAADTGDESKVKIFCFASDNSALVTPREHSVN